MTALGEELNHPDSPTIRRALTRKCDVCKAKPGEPCRNIINGQPYITGRLVHLERTGP